MTRVHIVGGGLAGLAAALKLSEAGRAVTLYEAGPACGGRARSYFDRELGCRIDNGNHLLLSGNHAAMEYLDSIGTRESLGGPTTPIFPFINVKTGERWTLRPNLGRIPWWILAPSRRVPGTSILDYLPLLKLGTLRPSTTVADALPDNGLYHRLLAPLSIAVLNTAPHRGSARMLGAVVDETLALGGAACIPRFPSEGLSESFVDPAVALLRDRGAEIRLSTRIAEITADQDRVTALIGPERPIPLNSGDQLILAVPPPVASSLLPWLTVPDEFESIINLHFRAEAAPGEAGFWGLIGGLAEWVFIKPGIVSITISAANRLLERPAEKLVEKIWPEVCAATGLSGPAPPYRLIREKRATFAATFAQQQRRPSATTPLPNLVLAGDWIASDLPATIEAAIRSGFAAAKLLGAAP
jgi:squalene-associated FAD-dependent desaturase